MIPTRFFILCAGFAAALLLLPVCAGAAAPLMIEKNVFSSDRKPPAPDAQDSPTAARTKMPLTNIQLDGVIIQGNTKKALIRLKSPPAGQDKKKPQSPYVSVRENQQIADFRVSKIETKSISLEKDGQTFVIGLFAQGKVAPPAAAPPAAEPQPGAQGTPQPGHPGQAPPPMPPMGQAAGGAMPGQPPSPNGDGPGMVNNIPPMQPYPGQPPMPGQMPPQAQVQADMPDEEAAPGMEEGE